MSFGTPGKGRWVTVYAHGSHAYVAIAGLRFDTSGDGEEGPRLAPAAPVARRVHRAPAARPLTAGRRHRRRP